MKLFALFSVIIVCSALPLLVEGQNSQTAGFKKTLAQTSADTSRVLLMADISASYRYSRLDSARWYAVQGAKMARRIRYLKGEGRCLSQLGFVLSEKGDLAGSLRELLQAQSLSTLAHDSVGLAGTLLNIGYMYVSFPDYAQAKRYLFQAMKLYKQARIHSSDAALVLANIGYSYRYEQRYDSARYYQQLAYQQVTQLPDYQQNAWGSPLSFILRELGAVAEKTGQLGLSIQYLHRAKEVALVDNSRQVYTRICNTLATVYQRQHQSDSAIYYARQGLLTSQQTGSPIGVLRNSQLLAQLFKTRRQTDSVLKYTELRIMANDSLYSQQRIKQLETINFEEQQRRRRIESEKARFESQVQQVALLSGTVILLVIAVILWRNNRQQHRANALLKTALTDLRTTQTQLIQREKMASLGELTAGIAHEIQNPLNFVNNFSEVSAELATELKDELQADHKTEVLELADELTQNLEKITFHGHRASSIVKGMLEHSRTSTGERQPTNLNALADEYLRLAYQGMRAKHKTFNAELKTDFDANLGLVEVVPQDIGRVLLNLYNNAFYAVHQKQKTDSSGYQPTVTVSTAQVNGQATIRVNDNGTGIPESVKAKIFQPFFTTKPTGEGTGLGLSLSYDIITKGHGGTLDVQTVPDQFTEFVITLPVA